MGRIRFKPELVEAIRQGRKILTFRLTRRPNAGYIVEEGGHPYWVHIDTGLRLFIYHSWEVPDFEDYANEYFDLEGFETPAEFLDYVEALFSGHRPTSGWSHLFWAAKDEGDFSAGRKIPPSEAIVRKAKEKFPDLFEVMKRAGGAWE